MYARVDARDLEPDALAVGEVEKLGAATLTKIRDLGRPPPGGDPTRPEHGPTRRRRLPRPTRMDARPRPPPRRPLHLPQMPGDARSCDLDHSIPYDRTDHPAKPGPESRLPVPAAPPRQDHRSLAVPPHARRRLPVARPLRHEVPRHRPRHATAALTAGTMCGGVPVNVLTEGTAYLLVLSPVAFAQTATESGLVTMAAAIAVAGFLLVRAAPGGVEPEYVIRRPARRRSPRRPALRATTRSP